MSFQDSGFSIERQSRAVLSPVAGWHVRVLAGVLLCIVAGDAAWGQCEPVWTQRFDVPAARINPAMAYDEARGVVVLFGGDNRHISGDDVLFRQLWEWNGAVWTRRTDVTGGPQVFLTFTEMTYDSWRSVLVVRHKPRDTPAATWEFDGLNWSLRSTGGPQQRDPESLTFDSRRGVTVLWGERGIGTWEWDGSTWTFRDPGPVESANMELVFDEARGVTLAVGNVSGRSETWTWDGLVWQQVAVGVPPRRGAQGMAYDPVRRRVLLYGGKFQTTTYDDTWAWDGTSWSFISAGEPSKRSSHAMVYDAARDEMVVFAGEPDHDVFLSDTWTFDAGTWTLADDGEPLARFAPAMAYDTERRVAVLFGGSGRASCTPFEDTWQHDGGRWNRVSTEGPPARYWAATTYDTLRGVVLLFGGQECVGQLGDTWAWNGATWTMLSDKGPGRRSSPAMAYDSGRDVTVLFGGGPGDPEDTWEWNGTSWSSRGVGGPSARYTPAMVYDERLGVTVLFGGAALVAGELIHYQDTWHWDGNVWSLMAQSGPEPRRSASMAYDSDRQVTVLYGGDDANRDPLDDMWQWDGVEWTPVIMSTPPPRRTAAMTYTANRQAMLLFGGSDGTRYLAETWEFATASPSTGDMNCDCRMDSLDIEPFIVALFDPQRYELVYPLCDISLGDINGDGSVNALDIEPFIDLLFQP